MALSQDEKNGIQIASTGAIAFRENIKRRPIQPTIDFDEALNRFGGSLGDNGQPIAQVISDMIERGEDGVMGMCSPGFHGFVLGASHPAGVAADILVSAWGQNSPFNSLTPTVAAMEHAVCSWVIDLLNLPSESGTGIVSGGTLANSAAVAAARNDLLRREGWDVEANGLFGAPEISVVIGAEAHSAVSAALRYNGLGADRVHRVKTNADGVMDAQSFADTIAGLNGPILVILQAGHINSGGFDPFSEIIPLAHSKNAWVHVDGAFGLWLNCVPELASRLTAVELADSWVVDLHKWLNAPFDAGMVITRDMGALTRALSARANYLPTAGSTLDLGDSSFELSRRARGVPSYAILRALGKSGVREMVARHCRLARNVADRVSRESGISVLNDVQANQVAIRCGEGEGADKMTQEVLKHVQSVGDVYPSHGVWQGGQIIRVSIIGYATMDSDADKVSDSIIEAWREVRARHQFD